MVLRHQNGITILLLEDWSLRRGVREELRRHGNVCVDGDQLKGLLGSGAAGAATAGSGGSAGAPGGSSTGGVSADGTSSTTPTLDQSATADSVVDEPAAGTPVSPTEAPSGSSAPVAVEDADTSSTAPPSDSSAVTGEGAPAAPGANDNQPVEDLPATGTE